MTFWKAAIASASFSCRARARPRPSHASAYLAFNFSVSIEAALVSIVGGIGTPTEVSTFAVLYSLALGFVYRKINLRNLWSSLTSATVLNGMIFYTVSAATIFSWALTLEGVTTAIAGTIAGLGSTAFLPAVIVITIIMGTMLESFVTIVILAPLLLPVALQLGIDPLQL